MADISIKCRPLFTFLAFAVIWSGHFVPSPAVGDDSRPFTLSFPREAGLFAVATGFGIYGGYAVSRVHAPDPGTLHRSNVPGIDRIALRLHSANAGRWSNATVTLSTALPILAAASNLRSGDRDTWETAFIDLLMFAESSLINQGLTMTAKGVFHRSRPWAYDSSVPVEIRRERGAALSFWSSHSSTAFNGAVFAGYVFQKHHPGSKLVVPVWTAGLSFATATAVLRVRAGQHFPTDVAVGAVAGSLTGWLVPRMHLNPEGRVSILSFPDGAPGIGLAFPY